MDGETEQYSHVLVDGTWSIITWQFLHLDILDLHHADKGTSNQIFQRTLLLIACKYFSRTECSQVYAAPSHPWHYNACNPCMLIKYLIILTQFYPATQVAWSPQICICTPKTSLLLLPELLRLMMKAMWMWCGKHSCENKYTINKSAAWQCTEFSFHTRLVPEVDTTHFPNQASAFTYF